MMKIMTMMMLLQLVTFALAAHSSLLKDGEEPPARIQCPTCEGETEDDCNNKTEMVACPIEAPICAVYTSISPEFICKCVDHAEFHTVLNECKNDDYCKMAKYEKIQCPLCRARGGDEATAKTNCDKNARIATCPVGRTLCVDYFSPSKRYFRRGCTTPKLYNEFVRKCQQVGCRLKNCTHPRCVAGEGPEFQCPSCHGRKGKEKTAQADCDGKIKMKTCKMENPMCEAVSYEHGTFLRQCTNETYHSMLENNCENYGNCKTSKCTKPSCMA